MALPKPRAARSDGRLRPAPRSPRHALLQASCDCPSLALPPEATLAQARENSYLSLTGIADRAGMLTAHMLGGFSLSDDKGRDVPLRSREARGLMSYLMVSRRPERRGSGGPAVERTQTIRPSIRCGTVCRTAARGTIRRRSVSRCRSRDHPDRPRQVAHRPR